MGIHDYIHHMYMYACPQATPSPMLSMLHGKPCVGKQDNYIP